MNQPMTLIVPQCTCCQSAQTLVPRDDLGPQMAICPQSAQVYRAQGQGYIPTTLPPSQAVQAVTTQTIDLSRAGYA